MGAIVKPPYKTSEEIMFKLPEYVKPIEDWDYNFGPKPIGRITAHFVVKIRKTVTDFQPQLKQLVFINERSDNLSRNYHIGHVLLYGFNDGRYKALMGEIKIGGFGTVFYTKFNGTNILPLIDNDNNIIIPDEDSSFEYYKSMRGYEKFFQ